ncbi:MAG: rod shape-determining protein RodA [Candidatus Liptonbacteria bacterium]|nr:rod shape-determining protein RodA [Candidatus Liptonbacteria bacterium]
MKILDLGLFVPLGLLLLGGFLAISSISSQLALLQLTWLGIGTVIFAFFLFFDWRAVFNYRWVIPSLYGIGVLLLVYVTFFGPVVRQTRSWLVLGPVNFQPVELMKIALILLFASYFSRRHVGVARWSTIAISFVLFAIPAGLVAMQPDLGSGFILATIWFGFLLFAGLPLRRILLALLIFLVVGVYGWSNVLKDYQRERITNVFYPERNVLGLNYSVNQSKIAIGSAGFWGKGYGQGTQTQLGFLTEPASDFVLAAFIEEWGIAGGLLLLAAFVFLELWIIRVGLVADRNFETFVCIGVASMFAMQFLVNVGSTLGIMPVVGLTFPFVSYGGSSLVANFVLIAIVNSIRMRS